MSIAPVVSAPRDLDAEQQRDIERFERAVAQWGHITTRQNVQIHYVELTKVTDVMRALGAVGLTTREACGAPFAM